MDITNPNIVIFGIFACVLIVLGTLFVAAGMFNNDKKAVAKRLDKIKARHGHSKSAKATAKKQLFVKKEISLFDRFVPKPDELRLRLSQTGKNITFKGYIIATIVVTFIAFFLVQFFGGLSTLPSFMVGLFAGLYLPHSYVNRSIKKRLNKFTAQFPEAIDLIVRGLRAGLPVTESISAVASEMQPPIATEFGIISDEIRLGKTLDEALWATAKRLDTPDFKFFVISLSVQQETGGNLAETLTNLSEILRGRTKLKLKIRAMISEGKASAYIIGALPFLMCGILSLMNWKYMSVMFTNPSGQIALAGAAVWMGIGAFILAQMIDFKV